MIGKYCDVYKALLITVQTFASFPAFSRAFVLDTPILVATVTDYMPRMVIMLSIELNDPFIFSLSSCQP